MVKAHAYFKIIRPGNAFMTAVAVFLGWWLTESPITASELLLSMIAAICSLSYGNVINDIADINTDRINHPGRPLPSGAISSREAKIFAFILSALGLAAGFTVSLTYGFATAVPQILLSFYAWKLKSTPLAGNLLVSILVAYALIYGGLASQNIGRLWGGAVLAFLVNMCREIIKDLQDLRGDKDTGIHTTAALPDYLIDTFIIIISVLYIFAVWLPFFSGFGTVYLIIALSTTIPIHSWWLTLFFSKNRASKFGRISALIKIELLAGLFALTLDHFLQGNSPIS